MKFQGYVRKSCPDRGEPSVKLLRQNCLDIKEQQRVSLVGASGKGGVVGDEVGEVGARCQILKGLIG